ncbi:MAG: AzlC family ABC transporter permease [Clostridia bacterium]|nr:AzlC family ABC transporter permease [Clostridia bacterium]
MKNTSSKQNSTLSFKNGLYDGLPIGLGYFSVSIAFGIQASMLGLPIFISIMISMTNLTSAGQLSGILIISAIGTILELIIAQIVINARYFLMSISLSQKLDSSFTLKRKLFLSTFITDEIFAVAIVKPQNLNVKYFYGLIILPYLGWTLGTTLGAVLGNVLPLSIQSALGIMLYAMFIAIIIPPSTKSVSVFLVVLLSAGISCLLYFIPFLQNNISQGIAIIISALVASSIIAYFFPVKMKKEEE